MLKKVALFFLVLCLNCTSFTAPEKQYNYVGPILFIVAAITFKYAVHDKKIFQKKEVEKVVVSVSKKITENKISTPRVVAIIKSTVDIHETKFLCTYCTQESCVCWLTFAART